MLLSLKRISKLGLEIISKNKEIAIAHIIVFIIILLIINLLLFFVYFKDFLVLKMKEKADISVYLKEDASTEDIAQLKQALQDNFQLEKIEYIPAQDVQKMLLEKYKENGEIKDIINEIAPFFSILNIQTKKTDDYERIIEFLKNEDKNKIIYDIDYLARKDIIQKISRLTTNIQQWGGGLAILFTFLSLLIVFNTVKLSILIFKEEINIQRLVGASPLFIKGPFLVFSFLSSLFSTFFVISLLLLFSYLLRVQLTNFLVGFDPFTFFINKIKFLSLFNLIFSFSVNSLFILLAIKRYLKI